MDLTEDVVVLVGPEEKRYTLHKDALIRRSTFFKAALTREFRESKENLVKLPEADVEAFAIFAQWIYGKEAVYVDEQNTCLETDDHEVRNLMVKTYIFADQLGSLELQNQIVTDYIAGLNTARVVPASEDVSLAYSSLPEQSLMRKVMVDHTVASCQVRWLKEKYNHFPGEFMRDLPVGFAEAAKCGKRPTPTNQRPKCEYHVHNEEVSKCAE